MGTESTWGEQLYPSHQSVLDWVSTVWLQLDDQIIKRSFLYCGISNALGGSQDDDLILEDFACRGIDQKERKAESFNLLLID